MEPFWENIFRKDRREKTVEIALKNNVLFENLTSRELGLVQEIVNVRLYAPGERVFQQGEVGVGMYIVIRGKIAISTEDPKGVTGRTESHVITHLGDGDFFGELALVEETGRRTASATAVEESQLVGFFKPDLMEIVNRSPHAGAKILLNLSRVLGHRLSETTALIRHLRNQENAST